MFLHRLVLTAALAAPLAIGTAAAHGAVPGTVAIDGVDVEQVDALAAGTALRFAVYGTPDANVTLRIEGGWHALVLPESDPGIYEGTYVIDGRDAIVASSRVTATLQHDGRLATAALAEPLLRAALPLPWADAARAPAHGEAAPPAREPVPVAAAPARPPPPVAAAARVPAPSHDATATLPGMPPPVASAGVAAAPVVVARAPQRATCPDCVLVQSVRLVERVPGGPIGAVAGAIAGAVLGKELGEAHHRRMLSLLGAIGGAVAGHEIGRQATQRGARYDVVVRTSDGRSQVLRFERAPSFAPGDTVRLDALRAGAAATPP